MRSQTVTKLTGRQDLCIFCSFRYGSEARLPRHRGPSQFRSYRSTTPAFRPPGSAAVAREKEEDEEPSAEVSWGQWGSRSTNNATTLRPNPQPMNSRPSLPSFRAPPTVTPQRDSFEALSEWKCVSCGTPNFPSRQTCRGCNEQKPAQPELVQSTSSPERSWFRKNGPSSSRTEPESRRPFSKFRPDENAFERDDRCWSNRSVDDRFNNFKPQPDRSSGSSQFDRPRGVNSRDQSSSFAPSDVQRNGDGEERKFGVRRPSLSGSEGVKFEGVKTEAGYAGNFFGDKPKSQPGNSLGMEQLLQAVANKGERPGERLGERAPRMTGLRSVTEDYPTSERQTRSLGTTDDDEPENTIYMGELIPLKGVSSQSESLQQDPSKTQLERRNRRYEIEEEPEMRDSATQNQNSRQRKGSARRQNTRGADYGAGDDEAEIFAGQAGRKKKKNKGKDEEIKAQTQIILPSFISVENLAKALRVRKDDFIVRLEDMGFDGPRYDHILDAETCGLIVGEFDMEAVFPQSATVEDLSARPAVEDKSSVQQRPPIVTIMGHVDHGKTTILDWLRKSSVVDSEHGGITQHIGAFSVTMPGTNKQITFLDTPGHAAFLDMRRRGANVTDIVILVVAADDSVMPQTIEAIKHANEAKVPMIVAVNKIDKEDANLERVKQDLARHEVQVEDYGGDTQVIPVSGKTGQGMQELEEATIALSEQLDHRAETDGPAEGWLIECKITPAGRVATVLVRRGTMRPGDYIVAGTTWARIRTLRNDAGFLVDEALPGTPVQIDGWRGEDPTAGLEVLQAESEDHAKEVIDLRLDKVESARLTGDMAAINIARAQEAEARAKVLDWEAEQAWATNKRVRRPKDNEGWVESSTSEGPKKVHFVIKADVAGSVEALLGAVTAIGSSEIIANVIRSGVGIVTESDVQHLAATGETGYVISFNQPVDGSISRLAQASGLKILDHNIIYKVTDDVKEKMSDELPPLITQRVVGEAEVAQIFEISTKKGKVKIAGCKIGNGVVSRSKKIRVLRQGTNVFDGMLDSLKNVKKDVTEMRKGNECGMGFERWDEFEEGDQIQSYEEIREKRKLY